MTIVHNKETAAFVVMPSSKQAGLPATQLHQHKESDTDASLKSDSISDCWEKPAETQLADLSTCLCVWFSPRNGWPKGGGALCPV